MHTYKRKKLNDYSKEYCVGIYADYKGFSCCLIGIIENEINNQKYQVIDVISKDICSIQEIIKSIEKFKEYADVKIIKINKLTSLQNILKKYDIETEIQDFLINDAIFMITSLINDDELSMVSKELKETYDEEFNNFDIDLTSYRINALAIGLTDIKLSPSADWLGLV